MRIAPLQRRDLKESFHLGGQGRQHRLEIDRENAKRFDAHRTHIVQHGLLPGLLGQLPGFVLVHKFIHAIGQGHDLAQGFARFSLFIQRGDGFRRRTQAIEQRATFHAQVGAQPASEAFGQKARRAARDIDVLAHQVAVDAGDKVFRIEVDVFDPRVQFGGNVVAQPLRIQTELQVFERRNARAATLAHLLAQHGQVSVHIDVLRGLAAAEMQHRWPEQGVKRHNVFADEVHLFDLGVCHIAFKRGAQQRFERGQVPHRGVQPHVEVLVVGVRDANAKVGCIAADVPVGQAGLTGFVLGKPLRNLVEHLALQASRGLSPLL